MHKSRLAWLYKGGARVLAHLPPYFVWSDLKRAKQHLLCCFAPATRCVRVAYTRSDRNQTGCDLLFNWRCTEARSSDPLPTMPFSTCFHTQHAHMVQLLLISLLLRHHLGMRPSPDPGIWARFFFRSGQKDTLTSSPSLRNHCSQEAVAVVPQRVEHDSNAGLNAKLFE